MLLLQARSRKRLHGMLIPEDKSEWEFRCWRKETNQYVPGSLPAEDSLPFPLLLSEWADGEGHIGVCCMFGGPPDWLPKTPKLAPKPADRPLIRHVGHKEPTMRKKWQRKTRGFKIRKTDQTPSCQTWIRNSLEFIQGESNNLWRKTWRFLISCDWICNSDQSVGNKTQRCVTFMPLPLPSVRKYEQQKLYHYLSSRNPQVVPFPFVPRRLY